MFASPYIQAVNKKTENDTDKRPTKKDTGAEDQSEKKHKPYSQRSQSASRRREYTTIVQIAGTPETEMG